MKRVEFDRFFEKFALLRRVERNLCAQVIGIGARIRTKLLAQKLSRSFGIPLSDSLFYLFE
jgi:hypothetical protein